ncbi:MAG: hypothetical protein PHX41_00510 [Kiritimatiellae bacterium]|nr:hypothetical protein [Kiritimatiellia bacterium]
MKNRYMGWLAIVLLAVVGVVAFALRGPDLSIPWVETCVTLPDDRGSYVYRQKGVHYAKVALQNGKNAVSRWLPIRPVGGPVSVYYYSANGFHCVRMQDQCRESLIDLQTAKTYLLVRTPNGQIFRGEILDCEDGATCSSINGGSWKVSIEGRAAEDITSSGMATNSGLYIGHIEMLENNETPLDAPSVKYISAKEGQKCETSSTNSPSAQGACWR